MLNLNPEKYSSVHLKFKKILPWIVNEEDMPRIRENACFVQSAVEAKMKNGSISAQSIYSLPLDSKITDADVLKYLGMASMGIQGAPFLGVAENREWDNQADAILFAERFHYPTCYHIGAGRHVLLRNTHLKGIGRNLLSINEDYSHAWGGLLIKDALKGYVTSRYVDHRTKLPTLKILGLFLYEQKDIDGVPMVVAIRDAQSYRLAQAHPLTLSEKEKGVIRKHLFKFFNSSDPHVMLDKIIENYIHAYSVGVRHKAISPDNLLVDGRWIDTESLDINLSREPFDGWISFTIQKKDTEYSPEKFSSLLENLQLNQLDFKDSWLHQLHKMCQMTQFVYEGLFTDFQYEYDKKFSNYLTKYFSFNDLNKWSNLFTQQKDFSSFGNLTLRGYFFDGKNDSHVLTFGETEIDSFDIMDKLTKRWEKVFWPVNTNWSESYSLAQQIEKMCRGLP